MANLPKPSEVIGLLNDAERVVDVGDIAKDLLQAFGGSREFANRYKTEFDNAMGGSMARCKMLEGVLRAITQASNRLPETDPEKMSDADLERALLDKLAKRVAKEQPQDAAPPAAAP